MKTIDFKIKNAMSKIEDVKNSLEESSLAWKELDASQDYLEAALEEYYFED
jgi:hypothetical protein